VKVRFKVIAGIIVLCVALTGIVAVFIQGRVEVKEVAEFEKQFKLIQIGDPEVLVLSVLGKPDAKESQFRIGQKQGFEDAYAKAAVSDSVYYLLWFRGIDVVFTVGINNKGKVSVKEFGGT
jgi:hypothetical protein